MTYFSSAESMVNFVNSWCSSHVELFKAKSLFVPAGQTPVPIYENWEAQRPAWLEGVQLMQVDDVQNGKHKGMFQKFFKEHLPSYFAKIATPEQSGGRVADLAILGFGKNGHVAFHEPGLPESFFYGVIDLSPITRETLKLEPDAKGVTYGVGAFLQAKAILLIVSGNGKYDAFQDFLTQTGQSPAQFLKAHPRLTVLAHESYRPQDELHAAGQQEGHLGRPN